MLTCGHTFRRLARGVNAHFSDGRSTILARLRIGPAGKHEARAILSDPEKTRSISEIAEDFCFADASSFSLAFKREFGYSPSEARYAALSGLEIGATSKTSVQSARAHFSDLLRGL